MGGKPVKSLPSVAIIRQRYSSVGGGEEIIRQAADNLVRSGEASVSIIARDWGGQQSPDVQFVKCDPPYSGRLLRELTFCRASLALARGRFDVVQSHERIPGADIYRAGDGVYRRWIENYVRVVPQWRRPLIRISAFHQVAMALERNIYSSANLKAVIANSQMVADDINRFFPQVSDRVHVIWNGVDCDRFHPNLRAHHRARILERHGLGECNRLLLFLGSGWIRKGLATAIRALPLLEPDVRLIVVGRDRRTAHFEKLALQLGVTRQIIFAGPRDDPEAYIGSAEALVLPSIYDPMPNATLEAMAAAVPIVVSSHTGTAQLVTESQCGVVCAPFHDEMWPAALNAALAEGAGGAMGAAGRKVALRHSLSRMTKEWLALYRLLLEM